MDETAKLRSDMAAKQGEYEALMRQANPDPKQAGQLSREISDIQGQIDAKAKSFGYQAGGYGGRQGVCPMANNCSMGGPHGGYHW
jgi:uncharacterized protein involved in exopolysaccharide biosynthesis